MESPVLEETSQTALFDLTGKQFNINWVDEKQPLFVANNPVHWKAHKLQIMIARLDKQSANNPAQFNSNVYYQAVNELEKLMTQINQGVTTSENMDAGDVAEGGNGSPEEAMGARATSSMDVGISADNPLTR